MIKHKFNAKPTTVDDQKFSSKLEAGYYRKLKMAQQSGELLFFLTQVPLRLPGGIKYVVDFVEFWKDGNVVFSETKGLMTPIALMKIKQTEEIYPITINLVRS